MEMEEQEIRVKAKSIENAVVLPEAVHRMYDNYLVAFCPQFLYPNFYLLLMKPIPVDPLRLNRDSVQSYLRSRRLGTAQVLQGEEDETELSKTNGISWSTLRTLHSTIE